MKSQVIWKAECKILRTIQNDKSPAEDGFTVEFYQFFSNFLDITLQNY